MLNLVLTTDKLQLVTDAAVTVDVHVSFADLNGTTVTPDKQNTAITTATTTDIVASPGASTVRNVKTLHVRNKHATSTVVVTVVYDANGTDYELHKVTLLAGELLEYVEGIGFFTVQTVRKAFFNRRVTTNVINATTSFADITGLTCPIEAGKFYAFQACLMHRTDATTTGARFGVNGPTLTTLQIWAIQQITSSVTAAAYGSSLAVTAYDTAAVVETTGPGAATMGAKLYGYITCSAAGTFALRCQSEVAVAAGLTVFAGSWLQLWELDN